MLDRPQTEPSQRAVQTDQGVEESLKVRNSLGRTDVAGRNKNHQHSGRRDGAEQRQQSTGINKVFLKLKMAAHKRKQIQKLSKVLPFVFPLFQIILIKS